MVFQYWFCKGSGISVRTEVLNLPTKGNTLCFDYIYNCLFHYFPRKIVGLLDSPYFEMVFIIHLEIVEIKGKIDINFTVN